MKDGAHVTSLVLIRGDQRELSITAGGGLQPNGAGGSTRSRGSEESDSGPDRINVDHLLAGCTRGGFGFASPELAASS